MAIDFSRGMGMSLLGGLRPTGIAEYEGPLRLEGGVAIPPLAETTAGFDAVVQFSKRLFPQRLHAWVARRPGQMVYDPTELDETIIREIDTVIRSLGGGRIYGGPFDIEWEPSSFELEFERPSVTISYGVNPSLTAIWPARLSIRVQETAASWRQRMEWLERVGTPETPLLEEQEELAAVQVTTITPIQVLANSTTKTAVAVIRLRSATPRVSSPTGSMALFPTTRLQEMAEEVLASTPAEGQMTPVYRLWGATHPEPGLHTTFSVTTVAGPGNVPADQVLSLAVSLGSVGNASRLQAFVGSRSFGYAIRTASALRLARTLWDDVRTNRSLRVTAPATFTVSPPTPIHGEANIDVTFGPALGVSLQAHGSDGPLVELVTDMTITLRTLRDDSGTEVPRDQWGPLRDQDAETQRTALRFSLFNPTSSEVEDLVTRRFIQGIGQRLLGVVYNPTDTRRALRSVDGDASSDYIRIVAYY